MDSVTLPVYVEKDAAAASSPPPTGPITHASDCHVHGSSPTPLLEAQIADPQTQAHLQALNSALANATQEGACLKCATEAITQTLTAFLQDIRTAKKSGRWSHEEKKAIKAEAKGLLKEMKHDLKSSWRVSDGDSHRGVRTGFYWKR